MAKTLTAIFDLVDRMSDKMDAIASGGMDMVDRFDDFGNTADSAFDTATSGAKRTVTTVDGVAQSAGRMGDATEEAAEAINAFGRESEEAAGKSEQMGGKGVNAITAIASTVVVAAIASKVRDVSQAFLEMADAAAVAETAYAKLQTIAGADSMPMLTDQIRDLSKETGIAAEMLSDVAYNAISAGASVDVAVDTAGAASRLAVAGFTDASAALSVLSTAMNSYGEEAGTAAEISDSLIVVQNLGVTTVNDLSASIGRAISSAAAFNVSLGNVESGYISLTKAGINTAEATTYLSGMFVELGAESSDVSGIIMEQTGKSFGQLMDDGNSLADVLDVLYDSVNNDAEALMNLWGSQTAGMAASAIVNQGLDEFNANLEAVENSAGATDAAYAAMADTTAFAQNKMTNSAQNLRIAFGDELNPALEQLYNLGSSAFDWMTEVIEEHPTVAKALTAVAVGVGAVVTGIAGVNFVTKVAIPAVAAFGTTLSAAIWPTTLIAGGIAALTAAVLIFTDSSDDLTAASERQYNELEAMNAEYERACKTYGETSEEALRLQYQMDDLSEAFEASKQTVEEFVAECDALVESHNNLIAGYEESMTAINQNETGTLALIQKLEDLVEENDQTAASEEKIRAVIAELNEQIPELALTYEDATASIVDFTAAMVEAAEAQAEQERQVERQQTYVDLLKEQAVLEEQLAKAEANLAAEREEHGYYFNEATQSWTNGLAYEGSLWTGWFSDINTYNDEIVELTAAYDENRAVLAEIEAEWDEAAIAAEEAANATVGYEAAVRTALESVQEDIDELCAAYDEAYTAARESIDGQIGLFDKMATETETSIADMQAAFESQIEYLNTYTENLRKAAEYGLGDGLIASLSDGSEESAGHLNAIIENIEALGASSSEAQAFVDEFNASFQEVEEAKDEFATTVATMETDFDAKMAEIEGRLDEAITNMNMEADAAEAAQETMAAYTEAIRTGARGAVSAAEAAAAAVAAALDTSYTGGTTTTVRGHASGTTHAEDIFIAGEAGPELIIGAGGSTVFPADETNRVISAVGQVAQRTDKETYIPPCWYGKGGEEGQTDESSSVKKVVLEIAGKGNINLTGGKVEKERLLAFLYEYLKPVLSEILTQEMFEEGDLSYNY